MKTPTPEIMQHLRCSRAAADGYAARIQELAAAARNVPSSEEVKAAIRRNRTKADQIGHIANFVRRNLELGPEDIDPVEFTKAVDLLELFLAGYRIDKGETGAEGAAYYRARRGLPGGDARKAGATPLNLILLPYLFHLWSNHRGDDPGVYAFIVDMQRALDEKAPDPHEDTVKRHYRQWRRKREAPKPWD